MSAKQQISDGRTPPFSYITHATMEALHRYFERVQEAKLSTAIALYIGIAFLLSVEKRRQGGSIEATRGEVGEAGGVSATNVTRYSQHLVAAQVLELEQLVAGGANLYRWTIVEPPFQAPHQIGEAGGSSLQDGDTPHQDGETPHQFGEAYIDTRSNKKKLETPCSPPGGDALLLQRIFDYWVLATGRNGSAKLTPKRQRCIRARLREGHSPEDLQRAIAGCVSSDWHMKRGKHASRDGEKHDDLTLILRDPDHVEEFCSRVRDMPIAPLAVPTTPVLETERATKAWEAADAVLRQSVSESSYRIYLEPFELAGERQGKLVLLDTTGEGGIGNWFDTRYRSLVMEALAGAFDDIEIIDETQLELDRA